MIRVGPRHAGAAGPTGRPESRWRSITVLAKDGRMRTLQYCYFALKSTTMSAEDITNRLLMQPDEVMVMGTPSIGCLAVTLGRSFVGAPRASMTRSSTSSIG
jgi:hypothetical protein